MRLAPWVLAPAAVYMTSIVHLKSITTLAADPVGQPALKWSTELTEEFDDSKGDPVRPYSGLWSANWGGCQSCVTGPIHPNNELAAYDPAQAKVMPNGTLRLMAVKKPWTDPETGKTFLYRSGIIHSFKKHAIANLHDGAPIYVEVRAKLSTVDGKFANWPGVWTSGYVDKWPNRGEIDIVEATSSDNPSSRVYASGVAAGGSAAISNSGAFHVYGTKWKPSTGTNAGYVSFHYDGKRIKTIAANIPAPCIWP